MQADSMFICCKSLILLLLFWSFWDAFNFTKPSTLQLLAASEGLSVGTGVHSDTATLWLSV